MTTIERFLSSALVIFILNDFLLHAIREIYPLWSIFNWIWIWRQGTFYDSFWSIYWGFALIISLVLFYRLRTKDA